MNWYLVLGRVPLWLSAIAVPTFTLLGISEPEWWATGLLFFNAGLQLLLRTIKPKS